jgi:UDP-glucuronate 4-epimerase
MRRAYRHLYGIRFLALHFLTAYGPRQRPDLAIPKTARLLLEGQPIPVYGDGSTRRDYACIADIVAAIQAAINYTGRHARSSTSAPTTPWACTK